MAGAFSGHLLHAFNNGPAQSSTPSIITSGAMSFDARAHGTPAPSPTPHALFGFSPFSEDSTTSKQIATLQAKLNKKLGPEYISQRPGPGGGPKLTYAEGWKIINLANEVFGFNGWSSSIVSIATDFVDYCQESKRFNIGVTAIVRVTLRDGAYHEDVGYGMLENGKSKASALDKCKKEAITDALKRTLRNFGNLLGNCLYDKSYAQEVVKIKVPPAKFDRSELHRRPEFEEHTPESATPAPHTRAAVPEASSSRHEEPRIKVEPEGNQPETPIVYVPRHLRQEMSAAAQQARAQTLVRGSGSESGPGMTETLTNRGTLPADAPKFNGLATPIQTPVRAQRPPPPRAPPSRPVATSPLARMPSAPGRSASFAEPMSIDVADQAMHDADQGNNNGAGGDDEDDAFPLSTQDDAFLATVDLGDGDLGRPIDYDEGTGGVSIMYTSVPDSELDNAERLPVAPPQLEHQVGSSTGSSSSGPPKMNMQNEGQTQTAAKPLSNPANAEFKASSSGGQPHPRSVLPNAGPPSVSTSSMPSMRAGLPSRSPMGGFHHPKPTAQHTPKPAAPACVRMTSNTPQTTGPTNALKRSADVMQGSSSSSTRPPMQGMGLAQRQHQEAIARRPSDASDTNDSKRPKR